MWPILMHEQVFSEAWDGAVEFELFAAVVAFGGRGKNFNDVLR